MKTSNHARKSFLIISLFTLGAATTWAAPLLSATVGSTGVGLNGGARGGVGGSAGGTGSANATEAGSVALATGGNPAAAIGATLLDSGWGPRGGAGAAGSGAAAGTSAGYAGTYESIGMRRERMQLAASGTTETGAETRRIQATERGAANVQFDAAPTAQAIGSASYPERKGAMAEVRQSVAAGERAMVQAEARAQHMETKAQGEFQTAASEVAVRAKELRASMKAAGSATESNWVEARQKVAADFSAYAQAVAHAQTAANGSVAARGSTGGGQP